MVTLEGQKVVVTGGSRGLGLGIVEALVAQKAHVTVVARDPERLAEVSKRLGVNVARGDVTDESLRGAFSRTFDRRCSCSTPARRRRWAPFTSSPGKTSAGRGTST
jgi:NAD(P)-dependent dehydrogenase (short-subunit alcohol dehydrogenase family)